MSRAHTIIGGVILIVVTAVVTSRVVSQNAEPDIDYSVPGEHHEILERIAGKWDQQVTVWVSSGAEPELIHLTSDYRWLFGGRFLKGTTTGYFGGEPFQSHEVLGYDNYRREYNSLWIDNMSTAFTLSTGRWDARDKTLIMEGVEDDILRKVPDSKFKVVYGFPAPDEMTMDVFKTDATGKLVKTAEVKSKRVD